MGSGAADSRSALVPQATTTAGTREVGSRIAVVVRYVVYVALPVHVILLVVFALTGVTQMAYFNVWSIAMWVAAWVANEKGRSRLASLLLNIEVSAHAVAAVSLLGLESGFQYYLVPIIALPILSLAPGLIEKFSESHLLAATEFEESFIYMLGHHGLSMVGAPGAGATACRALLAIDDKRPVLRYERLFFTMLDAYRPAASHWTLKAPNYAPVFPLVFEIYPDVRMVVTHRNPLIVLPSVCRLLESWCVCFDREGTFEKKHFARHTRLLLDACLSVPFAHRRAHPELDARIFDCMYDELFADPIAMVKRIYAFFDLEVTPVFEQRMAAYLAANRQGKYGRHRYSLEEYGIDADAYAHDQREYMERYGYRADVARSHERRSALAG